jgi:hypothetical protein
MFSSYYLVVNNFTNFQCEHFIWKKSCERRLCFWSPFHCLLWGRWNWRLRLLSCAENTRVCGCVGSQVFSRENFIARKWMIKRPYIVQHLVWWVIRDSRPIRPGYGHISWACSSNHMKLQFSNKHVVIFVVDSWFGVVQTVLLWAIIVFIDGRNRVIIRR